MAAYILEPSRKSGKKWTVHTPKGVAVHFGASGYSDFTMHHDDNRKSNYISRHQKRERWDSSGFETAGFWARWILWNKDSIKSSVEDTSRRFNIKIVVRDHVSVHCSKLEQCVSNKRK